ncbi:MAG: zinc ribbon domain-containing protein [Clostridia bacterium]|nr:zinc ribbon domain-containing protein [Clostridia bacterium]
MKRGIFRIIAGIIMILLEFYLINLQDYNEYYTSSYIGFIIGVTEGIILMAFGIRAYNKGLRSRLILHTKAGKPHTIVKWIVFATSTLLLAYYIYVCYYVHSFSGYIIYMIFATLSFSLYLLLYLYKKPCCLFSATLIFIGLTYLHEQIYNNLFLLDMKNDALMIIFNIVPSVIAGILYIIIAIKLYKENFSVKVIRVMGWIAFAMEFSNKVLYKVLIINIYHSYGSIDLTDLVDWFGLFDFLFIIGLFLYISVFKINTLKGQAVKETADKIRFCRKCGNQLINDSRFCNWCGTEIQYVDSHAIQEVDKEH